MKKILRLSVVAVSALAFCACTNDGDDPAPAIDEANPYVAPEVVTDNQAVLLSRSDESMSAAAESFALKMLDAVQADGKNTVYSPVSAWMALSLAANGMGLDGNTYPELVKAMGLEGIEIDALNDYNYKVLKAVPDLDPAAQVAFANSLFSDKKKDLLQTFQSRLRDAYDAEMFAVDANNGEAFDKINAWVSDKTNGLIRELVNKNTDGKLSFAFVNATFFKAPWLTPLRKGDNAADFTNANGSVGNAHYLLGSFPMQWLQAEGRKVVALDFGDYQSRFDNYPFEAIFVLPAEGEKVTALPAWIAEQGGVSALAGKMQRKQVRVSLPEFDLESELDLVDVLKGMGVNEMFDQNRANFMRMWLVHPSYVTLVKQKSKFGIDENGATGAAATVVGGIDSCEPGEVENPEFCANRPFMYIVREKSTGTILFTGSVQML